MEKSKRCSVKIDPNIPPTHAATRIIPITKNDLFIQSNQFTYPSVFSFFKDTANILDTLLNNEKSAWFKTQALIMDFGSANYSGTIHMYHSCHFVKLIDLYRCL